MYGHKDYTISLFKLQFLRFKEICMCWCKISQMSEWFHMCTYKIQAFRSFFAHIFTNFQLDIRWECHIYCGRVKSRVISVAELNELGGASETKWGHRVVTSDAPDFIWCTVHTYGRHCLVCCVECTLQTSRMTHHHYFWWKRFLLLFFSSQECCTIQMLHVRYGRHLRYPRLHLTYLFFTSQWCASCTIHKFYKLFPCPSSLWSEQGGDILIIS